MPLAPNPLFVGRSDELLQVAAALRGGDAVAFGQVVASRRSATRGCPRDQNPDGQVDVLGEAGCERVFIERASGKLARRPELDKALDYVRAGDQLVVTTLDRLGRSVRHLIDLVADLGGRGVDLQVLHQGIDTSNPAGRLFFHLVGAFAEFERDLISERTHEGLAAARARGRAGGRPPRMTPQKAALSPDVRHPGAHGGGDRQDARRQPSLDLPPPDRGRRSRRGGHASASSGDSLVRGEACHVLLPDLDASGRYSPDEPMRRAGSFQPAAQP